MLNYYIIDHCLVDSMGYSVRFSHLEIHSHAAPWTVTLYISVTPFWYKAHSFWKAVGVCIWKASFKQQNIFWFHFISFKGRENDRDCHETLNSKKLAKAKHVWSDELRLSHRGKPFNYSLETENPFLDPQTAVIFCNHPAPTAPHLLFLCVVSVMFVTCVNW